VEVIARSLTDASVRFLPNRATNPLSSLPQAQFLILMNEILKQIGGVANEYLYWIDVSTTSR
jgi:hypothetical protein